VLRDLNTTFVIRSMSLGAPVIYTDLTDYDEIAHHAGPERIESLRALTGVDQVVASLERAAAYAPREYRFVLLSDHGQSQGATFKQRYGLSLEELIRALMSGDPGVVAATSRSETFGPVNALLGELSQRPGLAGRATSAALNRPSIGGALEPGAEDPRVQAAEHPDVVVCASGNLANVYFTVDEERLTASRIEEYHPGLLAGLVSHPGIGFVMVRAVEGTVVLGARGVHHLSDDHVEGDDPLVPFGVRAADHLRRLDGFDNVGDLLINSTYDRELQEVAAFEELVGSHGGMGGPQNRPFLLHPDELTLDEHLVGAPAVHRQLQRWARELDVMAPLPTAAPEPARREPKGLRWVAGWMALVGAVELLLATILVFVGLAGEEEFGEVSMGVAALLVPLVVSGLGLVTLWIGFGIWRRQRWAWMAALVVNAFNVVQVLLALASGGFEGIISYGAIAAVMGLIMFWYLTRPHVAAAFGHRRGRKAAAVATPPGSPTAGS
jgi:hypothetical protein